MSRGRSSIEDLRLAIDCLPLRTRRAMVEGIRSNEIIVGAYADRAGGVCPMLAAHRCGGRTSLISFARAWDRFAGARAARRATEREVRILEAHLEASILADEAHDPGVAIAEHESLRAHAAAARGAADQRRAAEQRRAAGEGRRPDDGHLPGKRRGGEEGRAPDERRASGERWSAAESAATAPGRTVTSADAGAAPDGRAGRRRERWAWLRSQSRSADEAALRARRPEREPVG
jgi:hypothetical protein